MRTDRVEVQEKPFVILSAEKGHETLSDIIATSRMRNALERIDVPYKQVVGCWDDKEEIAFLVPIENLNSNMVYILKETAKAEGQEAILLCDEYRNAKVVSLDSDHVYCEGKFKQIACREIPNYKFYTRDIETGACWVVEGEFKDAL